MPGWVGVLLIIGCIGGLLFLVSQLIVFVIAVVQKVRDARVDRAWKIAADARR